MATADKVSSQTENEFPTGESLCYVLESSTDYKATISNILGSKLYSVSKTANETVTNNTLISDDAG